MRAIVTVIGEDKVGIIAGVSAALSRANCNIVDLSQTVLQEFFAMIMLVDISELNMPFAQLKDFLTRTGQEIGVDIKIQREEIFNSMHRI